MAETISCSGCGQKLKASEKLFGKTVKCPKCGQPLKIPSFSARESEATTVNQQSQGGDLSDMLDDEFSLATEQADESPSPAGAKCDRCGDELTPGSRYCLACGHNNMDLDGAVGQLNMELDKRYQKLDAGGESPHWLLQALRFWSWRI